MPAHFSSLARVAHYAFGLRGREEGSTGPEELERVPRGWIVTRGDRKARRRAVMSDREEDGRAEALGRFRSETAVTQQGDGRPVPKA